MSIPSESRRAIERMKTGSLRVKDNRARRALVSSSLPARDCGSNSR
jgi:hypothetical protein